VVLLAANAFGGSVGYMSPSELGSMLRQEAPHLFNSQATCKTVPAPTADGPAVPTSTGATIKFTWEKPKDECSKAFFGFVLYEKTSDGLTLLTQAASTQPHLRGIVYQNLKNSRAYLVHVLAIVDDNTRSTNLTIEFATTTPTPLADGQIASNGEQDDTNDHQAFAQCKTVGPITATTPTPTTKTTATVAFTWTPPTGEEGCEALFATGLRQQGKEDPISVTFSQSHHFRGQVYAKLTANTDYEEQTVVIGKAGPSVTVPTKFKTAA